jgi:3-oxoacyl-[acyl-carrier-protein] synthase-1
MEGVYIVADNIFSPIGSTTSENFEQLKKGVSGIREIDDKALAASPFYAAIFKNRHIDKFDGSQYTFFEQLLISSIDEALEGSDIIPCDEKTAFILSSTKGNIGLLEAAQYNHELQIRIALSTSAKLVAEHFGFINEPIIVSNACISGIVAILTGMRLIQSGQYENVVVAGADVITKFILSGFQAFNAVSPLPCKPFDKNRAGITLGEGAAAVILSSKLKNNSNIKVLGGGISNDANHISAPSRTGEELGFAINKAITLAGVNADGIDFISAHGTATDYNDEMEAKAINFAGLSEVPADSLKGYYGHTLGAAGLIESIIAIRSLKENLFIPTLGYQELGVSVPVNINKELLTGDFKTCLKTASGFGGCNGALVFGKGLNN